MTFLKNTLFCLVIPAVACGLTGCQDDASKHGGTYTAARHMSTGSNIPQRVDVANTGSVAGQTESSSISANNGAVGVPSGTR